jgi:hypothetical protein
MMLVWLVFVLVLGLLVAGLVTRQLPPAPSPDQSRRLADQAEQIERLEDELKRLKEQADFTEKLLTERSREPREGAPEEDLPG